MKTCFPLRHLALTLATLFMCTCTVVARGQSPSSATPDLSSGARARLESAAADPSLPAWQSEFMRSLAAGEVASMAGGAAASPDRAQSAEDGTWSRFDVRERYGLSAIYDSARNRMIVFGGWNGSTAYNDVWALSLSGSPAWSELIPSTLAAPCPRYGHSAIYDPVGDRMIVFAGMNYGSRMGEVWELDLSDTPVWHAVSVTGGGFPLRAYHSAIYDPVGARMIVFGGSGNSGSLNDAYALSLSGSPTWTTLTPTGTPPQARYAHSAVYDLVRGQMLVFGGTNGGTNFNDVQALSLSGTPAWTALAPAGTPPTGRYGQFAVYDPAHDQMVVSCGRISAGSYLSDTWALSLASLTWSQTAPAGTPPAARYLGGAIYDPANSRMVAFAGAVGGRSQNDAWSLSLGDAPAWTALLPAPMAPGNRYGHSTMYDPVRGRMIVFGGWDGSNAWNDVWSLSLVGAPLWSQLTPSGTPPIPRYGHSAIYDPVRDRMLVFGGLGGPGPLQDFWALSLSGPPAWTLVSDYNYPVQARVGHCAAYDPVRDGMIVFGGWDGSSTWYNDVWQTPLSGGVGWSGRDSKTKPDPRCYANTIYDAVRDQFVVFGGWDGSAAHNDVWALSGAGTPAWSQLFPAGTSPGARYGASVICDPVRERMVIYGGTPNGVNALGDLWAMSLAETPEWSLLVPAGTLPSPRFESGAVYDTANDRVVVYGGFYARAYSDEWMLQFVRPGLGVSPEVGPRASVAGVRAVAPNPVRGTTTVSYSIARAGYVRLGVFDVNGRLVRRLLDATRPAGEATVTWNGENDAGAKLGAGVYFVRLTGPGVDQSRRVVLLR